MEIRAAQLDRFVDLFREQRVPDNMGGSNTVYVKVTSLWANIRPMRGGERFVAGQTESDSDYVITVRNRDDIFESDQIRDAKLGTFDISLIKRSPRARFIEIEAALLPRE